MNNKNIIKEKKIIYKNYKRRSYFNRIQFNIDIDTNNNINYKGGNYAIFTAFKMLY